MSIDLSKSKKTQPLYMRIPMVAEYWGDGEYRGGLTYLAYFIICVCLPVAAMALDLIYWLGCFMVGATPIPFIIANANDASFIIMLRVCLWIITITFPTLIGIDFAQRRYRKKHVHRVE